LGVFFRRKKEAIVTLLYLDTAVRLIITVVSIMKDFNEMSLVVETWQKATMQHDFEEQVPALIFQQYVDLSFFRRPLALSGRRRYYCYYCCNNSLD
jgi:hypothetical protein